MAWSAQLLLVGVSAAITAIDAGNCDPACGKKGTCTAPWLPAINNHYCVCDPGFGPGNYQSCCSVGNCNTKEHGKCVAGTGKDAGTGQCECDSGYTGDDCTTPPATTDPCHDVDCGHGTCTVPNSVSHTCNCDAGWRKTSKVSSHACDERVCASSQCGEHGTCIAEGTNPKCDCADDYTGRNCETPPPTHDPCHAINCKPHGACHAGACVCDAGFSGAHCDVDGCRKCVRAACLSASATGVSDFC
jgi:stabilin-2